MYAEIKHVKVIKPYKLWLKFKDGAEGELDMSRHTAFKGILTTLKKKDCFSHVRVNKESGSIQWPGEIDIDPYVLHQCVTGKPIPFAGKNS